MTSIRNQQLIESDAPSVLLYENYVMYDRWMSYRRFNSYYQDIENHEESEQFEENERNYYNKNVMNFLVLKFYFGEDGIIGNNDVLLFDTKLKRLYYLGDYIHICVVKIEYYENIYIKRTIPIIKINQTRPEIYCLNGICENIHSNSNGYCNEHKDESHEFDDIDVDRLLTLGELLSLPKFSPLLNIDFHLKPFEYDDSDKYYPEYDYSDFDCYDFYDYDDRRHGPEHTIEDDDDQPIDEIEFEVSMSNELVLDDEEKKSEV